MLELDGSYGEGGGQLIRFGVALSTITHTPVKIFNIRAKREKPGLKRQHVTAIDAVAKLTSAKVIGNFVDSQQLEFYPGENFTFEENLKFEVGTAGSVFLVLQAVLLPIIHYGKTITITVFGGTDVPKAPTLDYFRYIFIPMMKKVGVTIEVLDYRRGYYPKGNGYIQCRVQRTECKVPFTLIDKGLLKSNAAYIYISRLPFHIAERIKNQILTRSENLKINITDELEKSFGAGCGLTLVMEYENTVLGSSVVGEKGLPSEKLADLCFNELDYELKSSATIDVHLADQILPHLWFADYKSRFFVSKLSEHFKTVIWLLEKFKHREYILKKNRANYEVSL